MLDLKYKERMKNILGDDDFEKYIRSMNDSPKRAFHINTVKISPKKFSALSPFSETPVPYVENSFYFDYPHIGNHPYHHAGMFYIQEPAAMFPIASVGIQKNWKVLDMCAAPGGKSSQIMQRLSNDGQLVSNEYIPGRCKTLTGNIERLGFKNATVTCASSEQIAEAYPEYFDLTVADVPCSGEGMFRKEPAAVEGWSEQAVENCAERQREILKNAAKTVKNGGFLLYSTCTFSLEENEKNIDWFLSEFTDFEPVPFNSAVFEYTYPGVDTGINSQYRKYCMRRFYPFIANGEGQYAALFRKTSGKGENYFYSDRLNRPDSNSLKDITAFLKDTVTDFNEEYIYLNGDRVIYRNPEHLVLIKNAYMTGVTVGTLQKGHIKPHHQFFSAFGDKFIRKADFHSDDEKLLYYLSGGSFQFSGENGFTAVCVEGVPLGGSKVVSGYLKNSYPKGLVQRF